MSVRFDQSGGTAQSLEAVYPPPNTTGGLRLSGVPVSITIWIYLEEGDLPTGGERATIWWFGVAGQASNPQRDAPTTMFELPMPQEWSGRVGGRHVSGYHGMRCAPIPRRILQ